MTATTTTGGSFDIGRVVQRTFGAIGGNFATFVVLALILVGLPGAILAVGGAQTTAGAGQNISAAYTGGVVLIVGALVNLITSFVLQAAIIYGAVAYLNGRAASIGECLTTGFRHWWRLFLLALLMGLGIFAGFLFFFIPGVILIVRWVVSVPVQVIEDKSATQSMGRSADLTRGRRWSIFALLLVYGIAGSIIQAAIVGMTVGFASAGGPGQITVVSVLVRPLLTTLTSLIGAAGAASIYYELRSTREGIGPEALAAVFD